MTQSLRSCDPRPAVSGCASGTATTTARGAAPAAATAPALGRSTAARVRRSRHAATSASTSRGAVITRRAALQLPAGLDTRLLKSSSSRRTSLSAVTRPTGVELGVVLAQCERRRQEGDVLALDELLDPPVGVVLDAEVLDRLALSGQVVEVAALHRLAHLQVHPGRLLRDPGRCSGAAGAVVARGVAAYGLGVRHLEPVLPVALRHVATLRSRPGQGTVLAGLVAASP